VRCPAKPEPRDLIGICPALAFAVPISLPFILWSAAFLFVAHQIITVIGYGLGMRATWR
jgi:hypothetical protein